MVHIIKHVVEVDQSIKIEQSGATILAFSNDISHAIVIPSEVKTSSLRALYARWKSKEIAHLLLFTAGIYLLLKDYLPVIRRIIIDVEYDKKEKSIKAALLRYIWRTYPDFAEETIEFAHIGKRSPADTKARNVRSGIDRAYRKVTLNEIVQVMTEA